MRNRAQCKRCKDIIESYDRYDFVACKCGEIAVDGGQEYFRCITKNHENLLRMDEQGNIIIPITQERTLKKFKNLKNQEEI